ncbi:MAG: hypothetical protein UY39_C0003G0015 [Candidatus Kaiserbacteria bacterium GW2011_GWC2_49_12]|uniref:Uncharacterized protein n=4 Tax=Candidatus Kaiseribacteriota TaxID=1752734 RepID=A0A0G1WGT3_9BACT|nr:MAG: hypothetical protein UY39_C0003G0015 [Candidatus Kaiserbacteria bacterium GW2011_GWC2_49_12]KKW17971.1 MAG: hypothetical protein UY57_C0005G0021 [Candidatus Kaiserbacteria bacterium GW2011_GWB1_50_17]KKW18639.1 MAG: hypothetical protein UY59_C0001G0010 [Candidatus Kaiserbacteria bacterium GW2011_GWA1_50_28]OGG87434.1 MAG: hypothetical protein A3H15_02945 [Candidatus Kaiserbacteria bacterium RIFCSPLOWO2_12_FULL_50_28]HCM43521.1 hypothetical protein [Candidatus Kaiserbacteria bacterium]
MSEITTFLAQIIGPVTLALGVGIYVSPRYYTKMYKNLENETTAILVAAIAAISAGMVMVLVHNTWNTFPEMVISALGWIVLLKGVSLAVAPHLVENAAEKLANSGAMRFSAVLVVVLGGYLSYVGFIA